MEKPLTGLIAEDGGHVLPRQPASGYLSRRVVTRLGAHLKTTPDLAAVTLFLALALVAYWPILLGRIPLPSDLMYNFPPWHDLHPALAAAAHAEIGDLITQHYPWHLFASGLVRQGQLPAWNPYVLLGAPFIANAQSAIFYPLNLLYYLLPTPTAWAAGFLLRTVLSALFTYYFARAVGASTPGAILAGIVFGFSGFITVWQAQPLGDASLWLPLLCLGIDRLRRSPSWTIAALVGAAFSLPVLAGQPEAAAHLALVCLAFAAYRAIWPPRDAARPGSPLRFLTLVAFAGVLAVALASAQILPTVEWLGQTRRSLDVQWGARPLAELLTFLSRDITANPSSAGVAIPEGEAYAGILTLLLAACAPLHRNRRDSVFFAVVILVGLQVAFGIGPLYAVTRILPVVRGLKNWRLLVAVTFGLAILAGLGLTALEERLARREDEPAPPEAGWLPPALAFGLISLGVLWLGLATPAPREARLIWYRTPWSSEALLLAGAALLALALIRRIDRAWFVASAVILIAVDLVSFSGGYIPFVRAADVFPETPLFQYLQSATLGGYRVLALDNTLGPNFTLPYRVRSATGYDEPLRRVTDLLAPLGPGNQAIEPAEAQKVAALRDRRLDAMAVKYLLATTYNSSAATLAAHPDRFALAYTDGAVQVFQNKSVLAPAFLVPLADATRLPDAAALARFTDPSFDPSGAVILPDAAPLPTIADTPAPGAATRVDAATFEASQDQFRLEAARPSVLVVSQASYPGWRAEVDGQPAPVLRVDYALTGVAVGPGAHEVRLVYDPPSVRIGVMLSGGGLLVLVLVVVVGRVRVLYRHRQPQ